MVCAPLRGGFASGVQRQQALPRAVEFCGRQLYLTRPRSMHLALASFHRILRFVFLERSAKSHGHRSSNYPCLKNDDLVGKTMCELGSTLDGTGPVLAHFGPILFGLSLLAVLARLLPHPILVLLEFSRWLRGLGHRFTLGSSGQSHSKCSPAHFLLALFYPHLESVSKAIDL